MRGRYTPERLVEVEQSEENFHYGLENMSTVVGDGTVTHYDASNDGGYAELATGTAADRDFAELRADVDYRADAYDVIEFESEFELSGNDANKIKARPVSIFNSGGDNETSYRATTNDFFTIVSGTNNDNNVANIDATKRHKATIRWYVTTDVMELYLDGHLWYRSTTSSEHPETAASYTVRSLVRTEDTASDRLMRLYNFSITYYQDRSER